MSVVKISSPGNTLAAALRSARPAMAQQAIDRANANLQKLRGECEAYVDNLLVDLANAFADQSVSQAERLTAIYQVSLRFIGAASLAGLDELEGAARSLCDVADGMLERGLSDDQPLKVHVESMRVLRHAQSLGQDRNELIAGLRRVRARYAAGDAQPEIAHTN